MLRFILGFVCLAVAGFAQNPLTAAFPSAIATDTVLGVACNSARTQLTSALTNSTGALTFSVPVVDASKICTPSYAVINSIEVVKLCSRASNNVTICSGGRAVHGNISNHAAGAAVVIYFDENYLNQSNAEIKAIQTLLGVNGGNLLQPGKHVTFSADNTYDIENARDVIAQRDIYASGKAYLGQFIVDGTMQSNASTSITLGSPNNGQFIKTTSNSAVTVTVPAGYNTFTVTFVQRGTGRITFSPASGVTILNPHSFTKSTGQGSIATLICVGLNEWILAGDLEL
jgi:hypothetical protein